MVLLIDFLILNMKSEQMLLDIFEKMNKSKNKASKLK